MSLRPIRVLVVDDSEFFCDFLKTELTNAGFEVVGTANNPYEARDLIISLRPDVLTLDVEMPRMDGLKFLTKLIPQCPIPVIVITSLDLSESRVRQAGGLYVLKKPRTEIENIAFVKTLTEKVIIAGKINSVPVMPKKTKRSIIAIGASTGGTDAIEEVITHLPPTVPPIVIVQHMPPGVFTKMYAERLARNSSLKAKEAEDGDRLRSGECIIGKAGFQMRVCRDSSGYYVNVKEGNKVSGHIPSVDVMFESVAQCAGKESIGVLLTGMGADGACGLKQMHDKGAYTIVQDEASCVVYGMPMEAYKIGAAEIQKPLTEIAGTIIRNL